MNRRTFLKIIPIGLTGIIAKESISYAGEYRTVQEDMDKLKKYLKEYSLDLKSAKCRAPTEEIAKDLIPIAENYHPQRTSHHICETNINHTITDLMGNLQYYRIMWANKIKGDCSKSSEVEKELKPLYSIISIDAHKLRILCGEKN
jgi:hypothetical protein